MTESQSGPGYAYIDADDSPEDIKRKLDDAFAPVHAARAALAELDEPTVAPFKPDDLPPMLMVLFVLPTGRENALSTDELHRRYPHLSRYAIRSGVRDLIEQGHPVVADKRGLYIANSPAELRRYLDNIELRIGALTRRSRAIAALIDQRAVTEPQRELWPDAGAPPPPDSEVGF
jgi:hypothetical protein